LYASPAYLAARGTPTTPPELGRHSCVAFTGASSPPDRWSFGRGRAKRSVALKPRLVVNLAEPAIDAAVAGLGITRVLSYMVDHLVEDGALRPVLRDFEPPPIPVHVVHPAGRPVPLATRSFVELAVPALRAKFDRR
jgi:DNA-binding transcriptional LysR family regulator